MAGARKVKCGSGDETTCERMAKEPRSLGNASLLEFFLRHVHQHVSLGL